ncbi:hypothetical protein [Paraburkholderia nodosa]|uniref:hypothetical protein n=1 Tax=Paraburkholderia nodosa TaxID=392320 RepID=UPI00210AC885|nr:hypothetical protein [Paraburkholderia nodosa]
MKFVKKSGVVAWLYALFHNAKRWPGPLQIFSQSLKREPSATTTNPLAGFVFPLIELGRVVVTPAILEHLEREAVDIQSYLHRHEHGDWGDITASDANANLLGAIYGGRTFSAYEVAGKRVWIITEADQTSRAVLFPNEY